MGTSSEHSFRSRAPIRYGGGTDASDIQFAVIGAGPYGLSVGTHLKAQGLQVRVFGQPMEFWADKMPEGMFLRSPRVASNISDPDSAFTLDAYEATTGVEPAAPVPLKTFVEYGRWFRHQLGAAVDTRNVRQVEHGGNAFRLTLDDGETMRCGRVVVAAGIGPFSRKPVEFAGLPAESVSHCYEGRELGGFRGKRVAVIGAGQSALESAALLHEAAADVEVIAKIPELRWIGQHSWLHHLGPISKMLYSPHDVGPAGISRLVAAPRIVHRIPVKLRDKIRKRAVRPAGSRWLPERLARVKITAGRRVQFASAVDGKVLLTLDDGTERHVDHVLLGTGYDVDIHRYNFLSRSLLANVDCEGGYPKLSSGFCSSLPGLHFIGAAAARSFGPLMYFVAGTAFSSCELVSNINLRRMNGK